MKVHWKPQPKQEKALVRTEDEILFGGARGGGKTDTGQVFMIEPKYIQHPKYRGLVIRRLSEDLKDWIDRAEYMYKPLGARFVGNPVEIQFPSGAKIRTGHLKDPKAFSKYQGHEYHKMLIEELTQIPRESDYEKLIASCRSTIPELPPQVMNTTNPDGDGYDWVKKRWKIPDQPKEIVVSKDPRTSRTRVFIPSKLEDNEFLQKDDGYKNMLEGLSDETLRKQWKDGSWEEPKVEGAYYAEQYKKAEEEDRITKVPYDESLPVYTFWDLGISDSMAIWFIQFVGKEIHVIDYEEGEGEGIKYYIKILKEKGYIYADHLFPHDGDARELTTGVTRRETAESLGLKPIKIVSKLPVSDGIDAVRNIFSRCWFDAVKCKDGLSALKKYKKELDEKRQVFKNTPVHNWASHGADAFRTFGVGYGQYIKVGESKTTYSKNKKAYRRR